jgi:hypothetical protein
VRYLADLGCNERGRVLGERPVEGEDHLIPSGIARASPRHGSFVGEYNTPEELAKVVDLAELVEDDPDSRRPAPK